MILIWREPLELNASTGPLLGVKGALPRVENWIKVIMKDHHVTERMHGKFSLAAKPPDPVYLGHPHPDPDP